MKTNRLGGSMNDVIWSNKYLRTDTKVRMYNSASRPVLTYGAEARSDTVKSKTQVQVTEMSTNSRENQKEQNQI